MPLVDAAHADWSARASVAASAAALEAAVLRRTRFPLLALERRSHAHFRQFHSDMSRDPAAEPMLSWDGWTTPADGSSEARDYERREKEMLV